MRCNQVSIFIERFGEYVPENYPGDVQRIDVYCDDATSVYAALAKAYAMAINELNEYESIGVRSYVSTNEYAGFDCKEMHATLPTCQHRYEDDLELQFTYKAGELRRDRIWVHENFDEIMQLIRTSDNKKDLVIQLKEQFGLEEFQIKKILSMRLDMLSRQDYLVDVSEQNEFESSKNEGWNPTRMIRYYEKEIREARKKIDEYNIYLKIAENYQDIIEILVQNPDFTSYAKVMYEKYGLNRAQAGMLKSVKVENLISKDKYLDEIQKLNNEIERCKRVISELQNQEEE